MGSEQDEFFEDNTFKINKLVTKILILMNFLAPVFLILSYFKIFNIKTDFIIFSELLIFLFSVIALVLVYGFSSAKFKENHPDTFEIIQNAAKYFGLIGASCILDFLGTNSHIGIYIAYGIIVFLSCLYYDVKLTMFLSVMNYIGMILSQYGKSLNRFNEGITFGASPLSDCIAFSAGFTIEFIFVCMIAYNVAKKNKKTLSSAIDRNLKLEQTQLEFMKFVPLVLKKHEVVTGFHVEHTVTYVRMLCYKLKELGYYKDELTQKNIELFSAAANLHDIGKIYIPDHILMKPGKFTEQEYEMMKRHPDIGCEIIQAMPKIYNEDFTKVAAQMALCHHERYDGTGYPNKIKGEEIPLCARIMAVADVTDALLSYRPYKPAFSIEKTIKIIEEGKGTQFEPIIADAMIQLKDEVMEYAKERAESEKELIQKETAWREQERENLMHI